MYFLLTLKKNMRPEKRVRRINEVSYSLFMDEHIQEI